jgi:hypothetical protein
MDYNNLLSKLPANTELHYLSDVSSDQPEYSSDTHSFILFEYTTDWPETISALKSNNIDFTIKTDSTDLDYILI